MMTVKELREWLAEYPEDHVVAIGESCITLEVLPDAPAELRKWPETDYYEIGGWPDPTMDDDDNCGGHGEPCENPKCRSCYTDVSK